MKTKLASEFLGTAFLLMIVVGSGIMGETLSQGNPAIALLANSLATGAGLFVLIQCLGSISGAHFNPVVSLAEYLWNKIDGKTLQIYLVGQILGAIVGVLATHFMFNLTLLQVSAKDRSTSHLWFSEFVATFGLISTIALVRRKNEVMVPFCVASYIMAAYWFTSSTSFANPAVTIARSLTNTFSGISPEGILGFITAQIMGALCSYFLTRSLSKS